MPTRHGNNPKRRIVSRDKLDLDMLRSLVDCARYTGSANHKRLAADYGFHPPTNRARTSLCATAAGAAQGAPMRRRSSAKG